MSVGDVLYDKTDGIATITINRPKQLNAFRGQPVDELIGAFEDAWADRAIGVVIFTGARERAFCVGGDLTTRNEKGYVGPAVRSDIGLEIEELHSLIRDIPKPVIAAVNGYAIGGGQVLHVLRDQRLIAMLLSGSPG